MHEHNALSYPLRYLTNTQKNDRNGTHRIVLYIPLHIIVGGSDVACI